ncbi:MAG: thiamine pyrophosphate-binding protein [Myxococcales bacterium]|nr:thiamine pyrophosphate-binding protein [Myxococcales bacterium]MCB9644063.1 thiamine pyrophosphate-binding protein [Myxococcales bacterium]
MRIEHTPYYTTLQNETVNQLLMRFFKLEGIDKAFGIPGGALKYLLNVMKNEREWFDYIICRQETGAAYMATGYAMVSGKPGVVMVTAGPGATNALTGVMNANAAFFPVLAITGEVPEADFGKGYLQEGIDAELDVNNVYRNAIHYSAMISSSSHFQTLFTQAMREIMNVPHRAAHISLPEDVSNQTVPETPFPQSVENYRTTPQTADPQRTAQAFEQLMQAQRPIFFLGNGSRTALRDPARLKRFVEFTEKFAIPVMTTPNGKGVYPESAPMSLRHYGLANCAWPPYYLQDPLYDVLMVMGSTLGEWATNSWDPMLIPCKSFIQVDMNQPNIGRNFPVSMGIVAMIEQAIDQLCDLGEQTPVDPDLVEPRRKFIEALKHEHSPYLPYSDPGKRDSDESPIYPQALMKCLEEMLPKDAHLFVDNGNCIGWTLHFVTMNPPAQAHYTLAMGPMGTAMGTVVGGKIAAPDKTCVSVVGDGAFLMQSGPISTASQYNVGAIWIVLNDNALAMVNQGMEAFFPDPIWSDYYPVGNPDLAKIAEGMGADAYNIHNPEQMRHAFAQAMERANTLHKPQVIVAHINRSAEPPYYAPKS